MGFRKKKGNRISVSIEWFEDLVSKWYRNRILSVTPSEVFPWMHHWQCALEWSIEREMWTVRVAPGFCHSKVSDPEVRYEMEARHAPEITRERLELGEKSEEVIAVPLTEGPAIDLPAHLWRALGTEAVGTAAAPAEKVPAMYKRLGVADPVTVRISENGGVERVIEGDLADREEARLLRAIDITLTHERSRTGALFAIDPETSEVTVSMGILPPLSPVPGAVIHRRTQFVSKAELTPLAALVDEAADDGIDEIKIATLYLLSAPGAKEGAEIDETWLPDARHSVFYPLQYRERYEVKEIEPTKLSFDGAGLGLGTLNEFADALQGSQNEGIAQLEAGFNSARAEGRFFTL